MRVIVCGGGIGGLAVAHGLRDHAEVLVLDRDRSAEDTGGYRISINDEACGALARLLPRRLLQQVRALSDTGGAFSQFTIADSRLRPILLAPEPADADGILAQRQLLRVILARGLESEVRFGATVEAVSQDDGGAAVSLADGSVIEGDVVVGADGADSAVVRSLLGYSPTRELGLIGIAGMADLPDGGTAPAFLDAGPALAFSADGVGVFLSLHRPPQLRTEDPTLRALLGRKALIWGTICRGDRLPDLRRIEPAALVDQAAHLLRRWHPWLTDRVVASDLDRVADFRFRAADPDAPVAGWSPGRVTALGDAIHAMPPTGGRGASTAICDADDLVAAVRAHLAGAPLAPSLAHYQRSIVPRARAAIRESLGPVRIIDALRHRPLQMLAEPLLAVAGAVAARRPGAPG